MWCSMSRNVDAVSLEKHPLYRLNDEWQIADNFFSKFVDTMSSPFDTKSFENLMSF